MRTIGEIIQSPETGDFGRLAIHVGSGREHWSVDGRHNARFAVFRPTPADLRQLAREAEKLAGLIEELEPAATPSEPTETAA